ncbi:hypothetical protein [Nannocystis sp. SCPEA4]|uniref:hypothetical protein n=1 Tax=Nannocystis sp. SCPEA4 TaxID=2996787 RepID=UPI002270CE0D|nr:hypothetical protein [Nannocystis sp. SCPEA4]MCY1060889.1 hypothetical protein [Nannocystis sp. SCPEA4]
MVEARALSTFLTAVTLAVGCAKNPGDTEATSDGTAAVATSSASETTGNPVTSTASSSSTTASDTTSDPTSGTTADIPSSTSTSEPDPSTGAPAMPCHLAYDKASCQAGVDCVFIPGHEAFVRDGECVITDDLGSVGFCYHMEGGGPDAPSHYYQVETGRVFVFPNTPTPPPEGWVACTCGPPSPEACQLCWDPCSEETSSGG